MDLQDYRNELDKIDGELLRLFEKRMTLAERIAAYKGERDLPVRDAQREEEKLREVENALPKELREYGRTLFELLFELSRERQQHILDDMEDTGEVRE